MLEIECVIPNISQQYKSIPDGGARIVLELSPAEALMYHAWLMRKVDIYQRPLRLTLEPKGADSDW